MSIALRWDDDIYYIASDILTRPPVSRRPK
jgi:hypothetical protein